MKGTILGIIIVTLAAALLMMTGAARAQSHSNGHVTPVAKVNLYIEGDAQAGEELFFNPESDAGCAKCHKVNGRGGDVGPSLSRHAGAHSLSYVIESILEPGAEISKGYHSTLIITVDGRYITGVVKGNSNGIVKLMDQDGRLQRIPEAEIAQQAIQKTSLMPENYADILTVKQLHDLLAFLQSIGANGHRGGHAHSTASSH